MTEKKKLVLSTKLTSDALLRRMKEKQSSFGTNKENTITFEFNGRAKRGFDRLRGQFPQSDQSSPNKGRGGLTTEELKMRLEAIKSLDEVTPIEGDEGIPEMDDFSEDSDSDNEIIENIETEAIEDTEDGARLSSLAEAEEEENIEPEAMEETMDEYNTNTNTNLNEGNDVPIESIGTEDTLNESNDVLPLKKPKSLDDFVRAAIAETTTPGLKPSVPHTPKKHPTQNTPNKKVDVSKLSKDKKIKESPQQDQKSQKWQKSKLDRGTEKRQDKISISNILEERAEKIRSMSAKRLSEHSTDRNKYNNRNKNTNVVREVSIPEFITVQELANRAAIKSSQIIKALFTMGMPVTITQTIDADIAEIILSDLGYSCKREQDLTLEEYIKTLHEGMKTKIDQRPPIVTVMGHVDHGKTSLLDTIRKTDVLSTESGGITQHIGAYQITLPSSRHITFIDTPGHEAFTEMRSRGASTTDIVVLVVAADDGVKQQTIEAISHAKAANVPIIVAINKIDKPGANPDKVREDLLQHGIVLEKFGGDISDVEISAKKGLNINKLEELILLNADIMELKANYLGYASGVVIESKQKKGLGVVASVLVKDGVVKKGDVFVSGTISGKVRSLINDKGQQIKEAGPSTPVEIIGFEGVPLPGDDFVVLDSESKAKEIAGYRERKYRESENAKKNKTSRERLFERLDDEKLKKVSVIIKADVQGSVEAIVSSLLKLSNEEVEVDVIFSSIGEITENDVILAKASNAIIFGFNVRANAKARDKAKAHGIEVCYYSIVYDLIESVKNIISGFLAPEIKENVIGHVEVRMVFSISKVGNIAGCMVKDGIVKRGSSIRLLRENVVIYESSIKSLKVAKNDVKEVKEGHECGILIDGYQDIKERDVIEVYEKIEVARTI